MTLFCEATTKLGGPRAFVGLVLEAFEHNRSYIVQLFFNGPPSTFPVAILGLDHGSDFMDKNDQIIKTVYIHFYLNSSG